MYSISYDSPDGSPEIPKQSSSDPGEANYAVERKQEWLNFHVFLSRILGAGVMNDWPQDREIVEGGIDDGLETKPLAGPANDPRVTAALENILNAPANIYDHNLKTETGSEQHKKWLKRWGNWAVRLEKLAQSDDDGSTSPTAVEAKRALENMISLDHALKKTSTDSVARPGESEDVKEG